MDSASASPIITAPPEESFQPGQLGMRHLLGVMTVAAIILGVSAARLRALKPWEVGCVAAHWSIVLGVAGATFMLGSWQRRKNRAAAGKLLLKVLSKPMTERRRTAIKWGLTAVVIADGILISLFPYTGMTPSSLAKAGLGTFRMVMYVAMQGMRPQTAFWEGALWGWCLSHWLANVYWVEFREHGLLMHSGYTPWQGMSRLGWSTVHPNRLVFFQGGHIREIPIDPAAHAAVSALLAEQIAAQLPAGKTRLS